MGLPAWLGNKSDSSSASSSNSLGNGLGSPAAWARASTLLTVLGDILRLRAIARPLSPCWECKRKISRTFGIGILHSRTGINSFLWNMTKSDKKSVNPCILNWKPAEAKSCPKGIGIGVQEFSERVIESFRNQCSRIIGMGVQRFP